MPDAQGPLSGYRVVDAGTFVSAPLAALMLADLGAEVVKVEPPGGDGLRRFGRRRGDRSASFAATNRGKSSMTLDLDAASGQAALATLLDGADVLVSNWKVGVAGRFGLADDDVARRWPRLVWVRISGFGPDGPLARRPAFDTVVQGLSGVAAGQGEPGHPALLRFWLADKVTAGFAAQSVLAALLARERTGRGAVVDLAMLDALAYFDWPDVGAGRVMVDDDDRPAVNAQLGAVRPLPTADGFLIITPVSGRQMSRAIDVLGLDAERAGLRAATDPAVLTDRLFTLAARVTPARTTGEWVEALSAAGVPAGPVLDVDGHLAHPQVVNNDLYREDDDPVLGRVRTLRHPAHWGAWRGATGPVPPLGEVGAAVTWPTPDGARPTAAEGPSGR